MLAIQLFSLAGCLICMVYLSWVLHLAGTHILTLLKQLKKILGIHLGVILGLKVLTLGLTPFSGFSVTVIGLVILSFCSWKQVDE